MLINIPQSFFASVNISSRDGQLTVMLKDYVKECIELCWLMSLQDPPVVFGETSSTMTKFDTNVFRSYTQSGTFVDFVVWPPMYLYEGGPVLSKGVAQGYKSRSAPTKMQNHKAYDDKKNVERPTHERRITSQETSQFSKSTRNRNETYRNDHQPERGNTYGKSNASPSDGYHQTVVSPKTMHGTKSNVADSSYYGKNPTSTEWNNYYYYIGQYGEAAAKSIMGSRFDVCKRAQQLLYGYSSGYSHA